MKDKIEITPDLLARIKNKAGKATPGDWNILYPKDTDGMGTSISDINGNIILSMRGRSINKRKFNSEYIDAANPSVMIALIAKIEEQEMELHYMRSWAELDKEESFKQLAWIRELQKLLGLEVNGLMKNTRTEILEKIKSLVSHE